MASISRGRLAGRPSMSAVSDGPCDSPPVRKRNKNLRPFLTFRKRGQRAQQAAPLQVAATNAQSPPSRTGTSICADAPHTYMDPIRIDPERQRPRAAESCYHNRRPAHKRIRKARQESPDLQRRSLNNSRTCTGENAVSRHRSEPSDRSSSTKYRVRSGEDREAAMKKRHEVYRARRGWRVAMGIIVLGAAIAGAYVRASREGLLMARA